MERPSIAASAFDRPGVRVRTLATLRWIAISGQFATLIVVGLYLRFPLPWPSLLAAVLASAVLNIGLTTLYGRNARLEGRDLVLHLAFDLLQAGVLLLLTGGLSNPFAVLLIVPVTIAATLLPARQMGYLGVFAGVVLVVLWFWAKPLPWAGPPIEFPEVYQWGVAVSLALAIGFLAIYLWMVSAEARDRARALVATEAALTRESRMSALGSLAAAAAHELGGPLGTITLVARSLSDALGDDPEFGEDIRLLESEAARSRAILIRIAKRAEAEDPFAELGLDVLLHEVAHAVTPARVPIRVVAPTPQPLVRRSPELLHGLQNLVANAIRHAGSAVELHAASTMSEVRITVLDDGAGFADNILPQLGEPDLGPSHSGSGGTGLGIFIATTLIERTGGRLAFSNRNNGGAQVDVRWPRSHIEAAHQE
ncbi:ActS/PrrB/RegB family redox-sensitive histidine kinase [Polymorphobacter fuscus]|uniref:histidine kinase n=1 Tax=Sandarakinorhabdus fusca TaxID=1439888 RepID=A0A7C9KHI3_9SPHN|nr:ActS/PrrB/RegB family redox-sensitive histidine kinase [Polymorphobacter fuscus]KAB7647607.1 ActS/PrrB/RegB family redox-sensitive histidine kinase [Polymorphobacter fuscus]MQT16880.1 ActS/PrrB/RegB family redox-sensitive histidine kinase [Polymorphobacter fuscus]NJC09131.1 two-component system sensor histidine kinase RegB [Polymorphobacter fuscus]